MQVCKRLHAIVFGWPGQGHLNPVLRFSEQLASEGCNVTFVHSQHNLLRVREAAAKTHGPERAQAQSLGRLRYVGIKDGLGEGHPRDLAALIQATDAELHGGLTSAFDELVGELLELDQANSSCAITTFIISDFFMSFTQDVANKFCIPRIAVFVQSAASFACHFAVSQGFRPLPGDQHLNCLQGVLPSTTKPSEMISFLQCYDPSDPLFDYMIRSFKRLHEPTWIVLNTYDELEHGAIDYLQKADTRIKHLQCGGPLLPLSFVSTAHPSKYANESLWEENPECLEWLHNQALSSVLFVSFGSLATFSARQAEEFAFGLENSMVPFLWVIRPGLIEDGGLPDGFAERVKDRACFVSWAPQMRVLAHPSVGGFLTHCGWNSVLEGVAAGVPLLGWSSFADQMLNCRCIVDSWGVGLSLSDSSEEEEEGQTGGFFTRTRVEKRVRALMLELPPFVKANCARLKKAACKAVANRNSLLIIDSLKQNHGLPLY